jgi:hypothetical protein
VSCDGQFDGFPFIVSTGDGINGSSLSWHWSDEPENHAPDGGLAARSGNWVILETGLFYNKVVVVVEMVPIDV